MKAFIAANIMHARHRLSLIGLGHYSFSVVHEAMNFIIFTSVLNSGSFGLKELSQSHGSYTYFVPAAAFFAGLASWDSELASGMSELTVLNVRGAVKVRFLTFIMLALPSVILFSSLNIVFLKSLYHGLNIVLLAMSFGFLGISFGAAFGMKTEKSLTNWSTIMTWLLALGSGFQRGKNSFFAEILPNFALSDSEKTVEILRSLALFGIGWCLLNYASRARRYRIYGS